MSDFTSSESGTAAIPENSIPNEIPGFLVTWSTLDGEEEEGPLSLLWSLIESYRVDIFDVSLHRITEDFMNFTTRAEELKLELAASFTVMAARLLYYKSRALLPDPGFEEPDVEERLPPELIQQLLDYRKFQLAAGKLRDLDEHRAGLFVRKAPPRNFDDNSEREWLDLSLSDIVQAYGALLQRIEKANSEQYGFEISLEEFTVEDKMRRIELLLVDAVSFNFDDLFENISLVTRGELVSTFLAILELIKLGRIIVRQKTPFAEIHIFKKSDVVT